MSSSQALNRVALTPRSLLSGIVGRLELKARLVDRVHVGSGELRLSIKDRGLVVKLARELLATKDPHRAAKRALELMSVEQAFVKLGDRLCIPGSTIKGLVRSRLELMAGRRGQDVKASACLSVAGPLLAKPPAPGLPGWRHAKIWGSAVLVERERESYHEEGLAADLCPICNLLGAPGVASRVYFSDLCCVERCSPSICAFQEYGMRLEVLEPGATLSGALTLRGVALEELGLLFIGLGFDGSSFKPLLVGRAKYMAENFGRVVFEPRSLVVVRELSVELLRSVGLSPRCEGRYCVVEGVELNKLLVEAFKAARGKYPDIEPFSEAEEKERLAASLNLARCSA